MYSNKQSIQQLLALMLEHGVDNVVFSPGSRNAPLIHTFSQHPSIRCYSIVDERSAAYFALGLILKFNKPVAICCTSGTALLNYSSAAAEAYYQNLPLLVVSADRPAHWVGQADGQTINQRDALANFVRRSISLPEVHNSTDLWLCNRLINEALISLTSSNAGPVHVNIPLSEPLYDFSADTIPAARTIRMFEGKADVPADFISRWASFSKKMLLVGQQQPDAQMTEAIEQLAKRGDVVVVAEHMANIPSSLSVQYLEQILVSLPEDKKADFAPDMLLSVGGHIVSKRLKQLLRAFSPKEHWMVGHEVVDTFQSLTNVLDVDACSLIRSLAASNVKGGEYCKLWIERGNALDVVSRDYLASVPYSDLFVFKTFFSKLPQGVSLHLGNSTPVRYAQLFTLPNEVDVYCNRGTSGIDGVVSTFAGFAAQSSNLTLLVLGELSFLYDSNGLWNRYLSPKARIVVVNNSGGGIFRLIDGPSKSDALEPFIECRHSQSVEGIAKAFGLQYLSASNAQELNASLDTLFDEAVYGPMLLEVNTPSDLNSKVYKGYLDYLKTK